MLLRNASQTAVIRYYNSGLVTHSAFPTQNGNHLNQNSYHAKQCDLKVDHAFQILQLVGKRSPNKVWVVLGTGRLTIARAFGQIFFFGGGGEDELRKFSEGKKKKEYCRD